MPGEQETEAEQQQRLASALRNNLTFVWVLGAFIALVVFFLWVLSKKQSLIMVLLLDLAAVGIACLNYLQFYKPRKHLSYAINIQSVSMLILATGGIHLSGGLNSPFLWLYLFLIVVEGISLGGNRALVTASLANAFLLFAVALEYTKLLPAEGFVVETQLVYNPVYVLTHLFSTLLFNYLIAFAVYYLAGFLFKQQAELKALDKAKDLFLSVTSHELRTPLTPMKAQLQMFMSGYLGSVSENQKGSLEMVLRNLLRLEKLIAGIMDVSKISAGKMSALPVKASLKKAIDYVVEIEQPIASVKNVKIRVKAGDCPDFFFDPDRITQVLTNLVDNAIKFSARDTEILVSLEKREGEVRVSVSDHGPGISVEDQRKLFTPFFQASSTSSVNVKGSGLGLVISKGILEAHKGRIWCESVLGEGTTFSFALPFRQDG